MPGPASRRTTSLLTLITRPLTPMREAAMVVAGLAAGTGIAAWSLVRNLGEGLPSSWGDTVFNAWILAWSADRLSHGLRGFWDAPFFYPYSDTLAFSEHLLGIGIFTAPIQWLTGNPIVAQNMAFLASYLLGRRRDVPAGAPVGHNATPAGRTAHTTQPERPRSPGTTPMEVSR